MGLNEPAIVDDAASHTHRRPRHVAKMMTTLAMLVQIAIIPVLVWVPFGFDFPSSWGLDFGHLLVVLTTLLVAWLVGIVSSILARWWALTAIQVIMPAVVFLILRLN